MEWLEEARLSADIEKVMDMTRYNLYMDGNDQDIINHLEQIPRRDRKAIVNHRVYLDTSKCLETPEGYWTIFLAAVQGGRSQLVTYLLNQCDADANAFLYDVDRRTNVQQKMSSAMALALQVCNEEYFMSHEYTDTIIQDLISHGASVKEMDSDKSPLMYAQSCPSLAEFLLKAGVDVQARNIKKETTLHLAKSQEVAKVLLDHGANIKATDCDGNTVLHSASTPEVAKFLLEMGAGVTVRNNSGMTPIISAAVAHDGVVKIFINHKDVPISDQISAYELMASNELLERTVYSRMQLKSEEIRPLKLKEAESLIQLHGDTRALSTHKKNKLLGNLDEITIKEKGTSSLEEDIIWAILIRERIFGDYSMPVTDALAVLLTYYRDEGRGAPYDLYERMYRSLVVNKVHSFEYDRTFIILNWCMCDSDSYADKTCTDLLNAVRTGNEHLRMCFDPTTGERHKREAHVSENEIAMMMTFWLIKICLRSQEFTEEFEASLVNVLRTMSGFLNQSFDLEKTVFHQTVDLVWEFCSDSEDEAYGVMGEKLITYLAQSGFCIDDFDRKGNSVLHQVAAYRPRKLQKRFIQILLQNKAHTDSVNAKGQSAMLLLRKRNAIEDNDLKYVNLQCLASRVIVEHELEYENILGENLVKFVELHEPVCSAYNGDEYDDDEETGSEEENDDELEEDSCDEDQNNDRWQDFMQM